MKKSTFFRIMTVVIILAFDFLVIPVILLTPRMLLRYSPDQYLTEFKKVSPIEAISSIFRDPMLLKGFLSMQPLFILAIVLLYWRYSKKKGKAVEGIGGPEAAGHGQFGTSRWQTKKETDQSAMIWKFRRDVPQGGTVLGVDLDRGIAWVDPNDVNTLIIGTSRSGKTKHLVIPSVWMMAHTGESMLITDPKGEIFRYTAPFLQKKGYKIKVLDFRSPGWGNFWNPMEPVIQAVENGDLSTAAKHAWSIANMFVYQRPGSDRGEPIWRDGSESIIASLILAVAMEAPRREMKHIYSVYKMLAELGQTKKILIGGSLSEFVPLTDFFQRLPLGHPARDAYATAALAPDRTRGSFFTNVTSLLRLFSDPSIRYLTCKQDHALDDIGLEKTAVFLIIPDEDKTRHPLAALYIDQTYQALIDRAMKCDDRLPVRVNFLLDEFGNMPQLKDFDAKITASLGRGIRWNLIVQDFAQMDRVYGENASRTIRGNCHTLIYLLTTDVDTAVQISKRLGRYTIRSESSSYNVGKHQVNHGGSIGYTGRDLLTPDEILRWPKDRSLVIRARQHPANLPLPPLNQLPADADLLPITEEPARQIKDVEAFVPDLSGSNAHNENMKEEDADLFMSEVD